MRYRLEYILFICFKLLILALPLKSAQRLGHYLGTIAYLILKKRKGIALDNLRHAFPGKTEEELDRIALGSFRNYGITVIEMLWFPNLKESIIKRLVKPKNVELLTERFAAGKGMILLSGHFGNWELIALAVSYMTGIPFTIIVQKQNNRLVDNVVNNHRCRFGNRVVPMGMSVREIIKTLQNGGVVAIAPDQSGDKDGGIYIGFFGRTVATHQGPAVFCLRSGAPLLMGFMIRQPDGTYEAVIEVISTENLAGHSEESVRELTRRHLAVLERYIRLYPDHWMWMHRRWKHTAADPPAENIENGYGRGSVR